MEQKKNKNIELIKDKKHPTITLKMILLTNE